MQLLKNPKTTLRHISTQHCTNMTCITFPLLFFRATLVVPWTVRILMAPGMSTEWWALAQAWAATTPRSPLSSPKSAPTSAGSTMWVESYYILLNISVHETAWLTVYFWFKLTEFKFAPSPVSLYRQCKVQLQIESNLFVLTAKSKVPIFSQVRNWIFKLLVEI